MLNYGRPPNPPIVAELQSHNPAVHIFVGKWDEQLQRAKLCLHKPQDRMRYYAEKNRKPATEYHPGDWVLVNVKQCRLEIYLCRKSAPHYIGSFEVIKAVKAHKRVYQSCQTVSLEIIQSFMQGHFLYTYQPPPRPKIVDR
jgi:hypothetical protein